MADPLAYFITWTTKNSWLHSDLRGWIERGKRGIQAPHAARYHLESESTDSAVHLDELMRIIVERTIRDHCAIRKWELRALSVRTNHVHVVVVAPSVRPETVMEQLKAWSSRRLNEMVGPHGKWWTPHGSTRWINDDQSLAAAVEYVENRQ